MKYISFESLPLQLNFQCVNFNICFSADLFSMPCTAPTKVLIYLCTATQLTKNSSVVKWGESYWRACEGIAWVRVLFKVTHILFPDCIITAKSILLHHGNGLKLYWLEYQSVFRSNLPCTVFHGNALQRLQCSATVLLELDTHTVAMQEQCVLKPKQYCCSALQSLQCIAMKYSARQIRSKHTLVLQSIQL